VRTVYAITTKGRERFRQLLQECFAAQGAVSETLYGAMLFLHLADLRQVGDLLQARIKLQSDAIRKVAEVRSQLAPLLSSGGLHLLDHLDAQRRLDQKWLQALRADVLAGNIHDVPDPGRLAARDERAGMARKGSKRRSR
jgi:hypothetical protein